MSCDSDVETNWIQWHLTIDSEIRAISCQVGIVCLIE